MAEYYGASDKLSELKLWYDGYKFGNTEIYNPWSVLNYFGNDCLAMPFWVQTSGNAVIREIIANLNSVACDNLRALLNGVIVESAIETDIIYPRLKDPQTNIFGFLLMTGYLKSTAMRLDEYGTYICRLSVPNREIKSIYRKEILALLTENIGEASIYNLRQALLNKDSVLLKTSLEKFMMKTISYYDGLHENYYHGLLLGMSIIFENRYYPLSNRESGDGRYDIELKPKDMSLPGIIIEIKAIAKGSEAKLKLLAQKALEQIESKAYDTELRMQGVSTIYKYGIAFCGKQVEIAVN